MLLFWQLKNKKVDVFLIGTHVLVVVLDGKRCVSGCVECICVYIVSVPKVLRKKSLWQSTIEVFFITQERVQEKNIEKI